MMSSVSNGVFGPMSTIKPSCFVSLFQVTVVPAFTQKVEFPFAPWILGVAEAELEVRLTSTEHDSEADPHVLLAVQIEAGFGSEHAYLLFCA
jgi:hypothetical protein